MWKMSGWEERVWLEAEKSIHYASAFRVEGIFESRERWMRSKGRREGMGGVLKDRKLEGWAGEEEKGKGPCTTGCYGKSETKSFSDMSYKVFAVVLNGVLNRLAKFDLD